MYSVGLKSTYSMKATADVNDLPSGWPTLLGDVDISGTQLVSAISWVGALSGEEG